MDIDEIIRKANMGFIHLPNHEAMLQGLLEVSGDLELQERFYPVLLKRAGAIEVRGGIIKILTEAIMNFSKSWQVRNGLRVLCQRFIDVLVENPECASEVKKLFNKPSFFY